MFCYQVITELIAVTAGLFPMNTMYYPHIHIIYNHYHHIPLRMSSMLLYAQCTQVYRLTSETYTATYQDEMNPS